MKIGVIADTHGVVLSGVKEIFHGVDQIIHAGDVGAKCVIQELQGIAPVIAVSGNHEPEQIEGILPDPSMIALAGHNILLTHRFVFAEWNVFKETAARFIRMADPMPRIVIFGHLHYSVNEDVHGVYFFNPGYAGADPYEPDPSVGLLEINRDMIRGEIIPLKS